MDYGNLSPNEAEREAERLDAELETLRASGASLDREGAVLREIEQLRQRIQAARNWPG